MAPAPPRQVGTEPASPFQPRQVGASVVGTRNRRMSTDAREQVPESPLGAQAKIYDDLRAGRISELSVAVAITPPAARSQCHLLNDTSNLSPAKRWGKVSFNR